MPILNLTLNPESSIAHPVRAGRILRVVESHDVDQRTRPDMRGVIMQGHTRAGEEVDSAELAKMQAKAMPGDLVVDLVDHKSGEHVVYGYCSGAAAQCYRWPEADRESDHERALYEPASVVRLSDIEEAQQELGLENAPEAIETFRQLAIDHLQRAKHSTHDMALLDLETGPAWKTILPAFEHWWRHEKPPFGVIPKAQHELSCMFVVRSCRNRQIHRRMSGRVAKFRSAPQAMWAVIQPDRHKGLPPTPFLCDALVEAVLPS